MEKDLAETPTHQKQQSLKKFLLQQSKFLSVPVRRGGFLFVFVPQQIPYRHTKVVGYLPCGGGGQIFLAAGFQICEDPTADAQFGAEFPSSDSVLGAEVGDAVIYDRHSVKYPFPDRQPTASKLDNFSCFAFSFGGNC